MKHLRPLDSMVIEKMKQYRGSSILKKAAMNLLVKQLTSNDIEELREMFHQIDVKHTGTIDSHELRIAMEKAQIDVKPEEIDEIIK